MEARLFVARFVSGSYAPAEYEAFLHWIDEAPLNELEQVMTGYEGLSEQWALEAGVSAGWIEQMERKLDLADAKDQRAPVVVKLEPARPVKKWVKKSKLLAAACVLGLAGIGAYLYVNRSGPSQGSSVNNAETLSILSVPRGQTGWVQLADGTKVWLNAASTLRYPASFSGKERVVELSGEALFEVAQNATMPFLVRSGDMQVQVLGTRFDMKSYTDEPVRKIALLEGSVKIIRGMETAILHQGDEAEIEYPSQGDKIEPIRVNHGIDPGLVLAWKEGYMQFNNDDLQAVMREIARNYDYNIEYEGKIAERHFIGKFSRNEEIGQILKILELQHVHFKINGKMITVLP
jgi:ferric-dicitrate binding protein FerR (iron transport regulator)